MKPLPFWLAVIALLAALWCILPWLAGLALVAMLAFIVWGIAQANGGMRV